MRAIGAIVLFGLIAFLLVLSLVLPGVSASWWSAATILPACYLAHRDCESDCN